MVRICTSMGCKRKLGDSQSDLCSPCNYAFNSALNSTSQTPTNQNRNLSSTPAVDQDIRSSTSDSREPPKIDIDQMYDSYDNMEDSSTKHMFGMLLNILATNTARENLNEKIDSIAQRLDLLESRLGYKEDFAVPSSLVIRNLPLPEPDSSDHEIVKAALSQVQAPNVNMETDVLRVVRKGAVSGNLGTVMVELASAEIKGNIMRSKKVLMTNPNPMLKNLKIKNMKSRTELKMERSLNELLKRIPNCENFYFSNNGQLQQKKYE